MLYCPANDNVPLQLIAASGSVPPFYASRINRRLANTLTKARINSKSHNQIFDTVTGMHIPLVVVSPLNKKRNQPLIRPEFHMHLSR
jgi:hypothetical protein